MKPALRFLLLAGIFMLPLLAISQAQEKKIECRIVYVPTEQVVVEKMLEMAKVKKDDVVFDLGCGDGRIVCTAAKKYGSKGVGVDIDPARIKDSIETMRKFEVTKEQVDIREGDA